MTIRNNKGFTLIEILVTLSIGLVVLLFGLNQNLLFSNSQKTFISRSNLAQETFLVTEYFSTAIKASGGMSSRAWMSIFVENNCAARGAFPDCDGSDRLTVSTATPGFSDCEAVSQISATSIEFRGAPCCLVAAHQDKQAMLSRGSQHAQIFITNVDTSTCRITYQPGQAALNNSSPAVADWSGAMMIPSTVRTFYLDVRDHTIKELIDRNNNGVADANELGTPVSQAYDFQVALGYDIFGDRNLIDNRNTTDTWLYNASGDTWGAGPFTSVVPSQLSMVSIGVTLGSTSASGAFASATSNRLLDGPDRTSPGIYLYSITLKAKPRNEFLFQ